MKAFEPKSDVTPSKKNIVSKLAFMICSKTILVTFYVVVHPDNTFRVANMHISANIRLQIFIQNLLIFCSKFITFGDVTRGRGIKARGD